MESSSTANIHCFRPYKLSVVPDIPYGTPAKKKKKKKKKTHNLKI
jgi:hypothetical protein